MGCFPAARVGDTGTHDGQVTAGAILSAPSPKGVVLIEGLPAAYVTCPLMCSGLTANGDRHPASSHTLQLGAASVLVHRQPAARWTPSGDTASCGAELGHAAARRSVLIGGPSGGRRKTLKVRIIIVKGTYWDSEEGRKLIATQIAEAERILGINIDSGDYETVDDPTLKSIPSGTTSIYSSDEVGAVTRFGSAGVVPMIFTDETTASAITVSPPWDPSVKHPGILVSNAHPKSKAPGTNNVVAHELGHLLGGVTGDVNGDRKPDLHSDDPHNVMEPHSSGDQLTEPWKSKVLSSPLLQ